jgi:hypothetical protein
MSGDDTAPLNDAQASLSRLAAAGVPPARITQEVGAIVAGWASEPDMAGSTAQARIESLWDGFTRDAAELQEQIGDAAGPDRGALKLARQQLAALWAVVAALAAAHGRLSGT